MHWFVSVFLSYAWTWLLCQTCWSSCWLERRNRRAAAAAGASRMAHSCHASSLFCHCPSSLPQAPTIIFMLFTQQQPLAVNLKSSFVNIIFLHFIKISNNGFRKKPYLLLHKNPRDDAGSFAHLILASWRWSSYTVSFWISHLCSMRVTRTGALGMVVEQEGLRSIRGASFEPLSH